MSFVGEASVVTECGGRATNGSSCTFRTVGTSRARISSDVIGGRSCDSTTNTVVTSSTKRKGRNEADSVTSLANGTTSAVRLVSVARVVRVSTKTTGEVSGEVGSSRTVVARNTKFRLGTVEVEGAVETGRTDITRSLSFRISSGSRGARNRRRQTNSAVETDGTFVVSRIGDVLSSRAVVTSLAISIRSSEIGDSTSLASIARNTRSIGSTTSGRIVGSSRARERVGSSFRAVETSRADFSLDTISGSRNT